MMLTPSPIKNVIGHRGCAGLKPENTICGFEELARLGANWVEYDIRKVENKWVLLHDRTLDRTTTSCGNIYDFKYDDLLNIDNGSKFDKKYQDQRIPSLEKIYELCQTLELIQNVEVKGSWDTPLEHAQCLTDFFKDKIPSNWHKPIVSNFDINFLIEFRKLNQNFQIGYLVEEINKNVIKTFHDWEFTTINCWLDKLTEKSLDLALQENIPVTIFTINDKKIADFWIEKGASAIFTDYPNIMLG